jgi:hypothetical protein
MRKKGVVWSDQPESFFAKSYKLLTFDERIAFLANHVAEDASDGETEPEG